MYICVCVHIVLYEYSFKHIFIIGVASRWHTDGIAGHNCLMTEENYDIYRTGSFLFFSGWRGIPFLHNILQTPSPRFDEHTTMRESINRYVHHQMNIADQGGIVVQGIKTKM